MCSSSLLVIMMTGTWGYRAFICVQEDDVHLVVVFVQLVQSLGATHHGDYLIALLLQEKDVRFQQVDFIVGPQYCYFIHAFITQSGLNYCVLDGQKKRLGLSVRSSS